MHLEFPRSRILLENTEWEYVVLLPQPLALQQQLQLEYVVRLLMLAGNFGEIKMEMCWHFGSNVLVVVAGVPSEPMLG